MLLFSLSLVSSVPEERFTPLSHGQVFANVFAKAEERFLEAVAFGAGPARSHRSCTVSMTVSTVAQTRAEMHTVVDIAQHRVLCMPCRALSTPCGALINKGWGFIVAS